MKLRSAPAMLLLAAAAAAATLAGNSLRSPASALAAETQPRPSSSSLEAALSYITNDANKQRFVQDLLDLVSIPSISSLPERKPDVEKAAIWCSERLKRAGLENVKIIRATEEDLSSSSSPPAVYGDWLHAGANKAIVLIYGHFDVQPADGETEPWTDPPFRPVVRGGAVWGRGAQVREEEDFSFSILCFFPLSTTSQH
jgi:hypothetical protein